MQIKGEHQQIDPQYFYWTCHLISTGPYPPFQWGLLFSMFPSTFPICPFNIPILNVNYAPDTKPNPGDTTVNKKGIVPVSKSLTGIWKTQTLHSASDFRCGIRYAGLWSALRTFINRSHVSDIGTIARWHLQLSHKIRLRKHLQSPNYALTRVTVKGELSCISIPAVNSAFWIFPRLGYILPKWQW